MQVHSSRFGKIDIDHSDILLMPQGLIGFETCRHWVLLSNPCTPQAAWMQSVALPNVALPVVSPRLFAPEYRVHIASRQLSMLHLRSDDQIYVLTVVSKNGLTLTTNLKSPILLNATRQMGIQCVTTDDAPLALRIGLSSTSLETSRPSVTQSQKRAA